MTRMHELNNLKFYSHGCLVENLEHNNNNLCCRLEYEQKRDMQAPIIKLKETRESLEKELKSLQERESEARAEAEQISNQMEELKAEAEGMHLKLAFVHFWLTIQDYLKEPTG